MKHSISIAALVLMVLATVGCSPNEATHAPTQLPASLTSRYANSTNLQDWEHAAEEISSIYAFVCEKGIVKSRIVTTENNPTGFIIPLAQVKDLSQCKLYTIANHELCLNIETIGEGTSEQEILKLISTTPDDGILRAPVYSAINPLNGYEGGAQIPIALARNMARFDLKLDKEIAIYSIKIGQLPSTGSVFGSNSRPSYDRNILFDYSTAPLTQSVVGLFFSYEKVEASTSSTIEIDAALNGYRALIQLNVEEIKRNHLYTLALKSKHNLIESEVTISDGFEDGDDVTADSPEKNEIVIDLDKSTISKDVAINEAKNTLHFPSTGGEAIIALTGNFAKELVGYDGSWPGFKIEEQTDNRYKISLADRKNIIGTDTPAFILYFAKEGEHTDRLKAQRIVVTIANHSSFSMATLAGIEWMPFNGFSVDPSQYPAFKPEENARNYYRKAWNTYAGKGVQWGPRPGRNGTTLLSWAAWENIFWYDPNITNGNLAGINGDIIGKNDCVKWENTTIPCPKGWRLPLKEEYEKIWPPHATELAEGKETEYTTSAGRFKAKIETIGNKNLIITELSTSNEVIFPIAGFRSANGVHDNLYDYLGWNVGTEVYYWCQVRTSGNAPIVGVAKGKSVVNEHNPANWNQVRCVRNNN